MAVIKNKRILKYLLMMVVSLLLVLNFSVGVSASSGYDRQEADACITISQRLSVKGGSKSISYDEYSNICEKSIHNPGKDKVMLGKYDDGGPTSYITKAGDEYTYFDLGNDWDSIKVKYGFTDEDMFSLFNESFLDNGINAGKTFYFSHNPIVDKGFLGMEYKYLLKNNYMWDSDTMTMSSI